MATHRECVAILLYYFIDVKLFKKITNSHALSPPIA